MPIDGSINPSATYGEEDNAAHTPVGGRYQVQRGYKEAWAINGPISRRHANQAEVDADPYAVKFITDSATDQSDPKP